MFQTAPPTVYQCSTAGLSLLVAPTVGVIAKLVFGESSQRNLSDSDQFYHAN